MNQNKIFRIFLHTIAIINIFFTFITIYGLIISINQLTILEFSIYFIFLLMMISNIIAYYLLLDLNKQVNRYE
jgi:hypothetical protein